MNGEPSLGDPIALLPDREVDLVKYKKCSFCEQDLPVADFVKDKTIKSGFGARCRRCDRARIKKWYTTLKGMSLEYRNRQKKSFKRSRSLSGRYRISIRNAETRGLSWDISKESFASITSLPCSYCSGLLPEAGCGLDRVDNKVGYTEINVVPCCTVCNKVRNIFFTSEEMIEFIGPAIKRLMEKRNGRG